MSLHHIPKDDAWKQAHISRLVGLAMAVGAVLVFALLCPREGRVNPILNTDFTEQVLLMILIVMFVSGAMLAIAGTPIGMPMTTVP